MANIKEKTRQKASEAIIARDQAQMSPSYARVFPLVVSEAKGSEIWDVDRKKYIDFMSGVGVLNVGHRHPHVVSAVQEQMQAFWHICQSDFYSEIAVEVAEKLEAIRPFSEKSKVFFANSGTEAIEAAIKLALHHTGRSKFIGFLGGFHGRTLGALSLTASKVVQSAHFPNAVQTYHLPFPDPYRPTLATFPGEDIGQAVLRHLEEEIFTKKVLPTEVAAIVVEPIQGEGGYIVPPRGFFPALRKLCDAHGILLIVDEVQAGVGRTGRWWGIQHEDVEPDLIAFAKGIASGIPLGGILAKESLMTWGPGAHANTFGGNALALAAAKATLEVIESESLLIRAELLGKSIKTRLKAFQKRYPFIGDVRGRGLMLGMECIAEPQRKTRAPGMRNTIVQQAFQNGLLLLPCGPNSIRLIPPLNVPEKLVDEALDILEKTLEDVAASYSNSAFSLPSPQRSEKSKAA